MFRISPESLGLKLCGQSTHSQEQSQSGTEAAISVWPGGSVTLAVLMIIDSVVTMATKLTLTSWSYVRTHRLLETCKAQSQRQIAFWSFCLIELECQFPISFHSMQVADLRSFALARGDITQRNFCPDHFKTSCRASVGKS